MDSEDPLQRLQSLQRDLISFVEARLANLDRLAAELDASAEDLRKLFDKKQKNDASRKLLTPTASSTPDTVKIEETEYKVNEEFKQAALQVADELNLDELEAAKLCLDAIPRAHSDPDLPYRAILRFHEQRRCVLGCLQLLLHYTVELNENADEASTLRTYLSRVMSTPGRQPLDFSAYWDKCVGALTDVELAVRKVENHKQALVMTGQTSNADLGEALDAQRVILTMQHEALTACMTYLIRGNYVNHQGFRSFITKTASLEAALDLTIHYLPILISGSSYFGAGDGTPVDAALDLHKLFAAGPAQMIYKQPQLQAAATICWLAEYSARFTDTLADPVLRVADRQKAEEERSALFFEAVKRRGMHFLLAACTHMHSEVWHNPARLGLVEFLLGETQRAPLDAPKPSHEYVKVAMREMQSYTESFVTHMPDVLRRLRSKEDDQRRVNYSRPSSEANIYEPDLERFIVIMSYAYQDDAEAAQDFWVDREGNLYGFLKWVSQRLPTPRVAAFCDLLGSIANETKNANHAHRFLLEDTVMMSGKLRKAYNVSWAQIFSELETFANSTKGRLAVQTAGNTEASMTDLMENETAIMLEAYLRLATHVCTISPEARNWILREQTFQLSEVLFQLASSSIEPRIQACCFNLQAALLTDKIAEVNDGMWVMLDNWITGSGSAGSVTPRPAQPGRSTIPEKYYLQRFGENPETATAFVGLINALVVPITNARDSLSDALPFPENLGVPNRHAGIESYIDFIMGTVFRSSSNHLRNGYDGSYVELLRCTALECMVLCLSSFDEDLVLLANTNTRVSVDAAVQCSSLAAYVRLHPFARVMEWLLNKNVIDVLAITIQQLDHEIESVEVDSPRVLSALKAVQVLRLAMKLQATYFDLVRPLQKVGSATGAPQIGNAAFSSFDEVLLSQLPTVACVVSLIASKHLQLSIASIDLLQALASSRKLNSTPGQRLESSRLVGLVSANRDAVAADLQQDFQIDEHDIELGHAPPKFTRASAFLEFLTKSLDGSARHPGIAHSLLGFECTGDTVQILPGSPLAQGTSLFHAIITYAAEGLVAIPPSNVSWLLAVKRGCLEVILRLATSPITATYIIREARSMGFLEAFSKNQDLATINPFWDELGLDDIQLLLTSGTQAVQDLIRIREIYFTYATIELKTAGANQAFSVVERISELLCGNISLTQSERVQTLSVFELFDFFELDVLAAPDADIDLLSDVDCSVRIKDVDRIGTIYNMSMIEKLLTLKKRELLSSGPSADTPDEQQVDNEIQAILISLQGQNSWIGVQTLRVAALEAWCNLLAITVTAGGMNEPAKIQFARQALQVALPRFEKCLSYSMEAAKLLARLILIMTQVAASARRSVEKDLGTVSVERYLLTFRISVKALTDGTSDATLRDTCFRICCTVIDALPTSLVHGKTSPSTNARQLLQLVQLAGDRLFTVITQDAFADRGATRVSAIMCLDALVELFQNARSNTQLLKILSKLNFIPILIDASIGNVAVSFQGHNDELTTTIAYFHTALALLLRLCQTSDGSQLVLQSGFYDAVTNSRLFSTDPDIGLDIDNPTALKQFYMLLSAVLRVIVAIVIARGPSNLVTIQEAKTFLQQNRFSMQAVFKRTSAVQKTAGPPEPEAMVVAEEFGRLILVTGFLEDDEPQHQRLAKINGFS